MEPTQPDIDKFLDILTSTPRRLVTCTAGVGEHELHESPGLGQWSVAEVLAHLRACEELWSYSIYAMLSQENPTLALLDERKWARVTRYAEGSFQNNFQTFVLRRAELVAVLRGLPFDAWSRSADIGGRRHTIFGQVRRIALHELEHVEQIEALFQCDNP